MAPSDIIIDTRRPAHKDFFIQASTLSGKRSEKLQVELGVCQPDSFKASPSSIDEVIERFTTTDKSQPNVFIYPYKAWSGLFKSSCRACRTPSFRVVDASGEQTRAPITIDDDLNIRIKTAQGMSFKGRLVAYFDEQTDAACHNLNPQEQSIDVKLEICG